MDYAVPADTRRHTRGAVDHDGLGGGDSGAEDSASGSRLPDPARAAGGGAGQPRHDAALRADEGHHDYQTAQGPGGGGDLRQEPDPGGARDAEARGRGGEAKAGGAGGEARGAGEARRAGEEDGAAVEVDPGG